jgi:hypothetical protein
MPPTFSSRRITGSLKRGSVKRGSVMASSLVRGALCRLKHEENPLAVTAVPSLDPDLLDESSSIPTAVACLRFQELPA